jgi:cytochrome c oxidase cbb3-type subunit 2
MPKYVVGAVMVVITIFSSIAVTIVAGTTYMNTEIQPSEHAKHNAKIWGHSAWSFSDPLMKGNNAPTAAGRGKVIFIREGCGWCHTMLPEQTQDWTYFGAPPLAVDVQLESPSLFGSDRKAPDLLHIASRNRVKAWHYVHHRNPRAVTPDSIMPAFQHLTDDELDALVAFLESLK